MSPKPLFRTPPATKGTARAVAAPAVPALGVCTRHMNRHQLCRLASYCRSKRLILHSLIASAATTANAAHPTNPSAAITDIATCTAVTPDMWVQFTLTIVGALTGFCALGLFVAQALWFGVVAPPDRVEGQRLNHAQRQGARCCCGRSLAPSRSSARRASGAPHEPRCYQFWGVRSTSDSFGPRW